MEKIIEILDKFLIFYNTVSERKISREEFASILPKIFMVLKHFSLDDIELIRLTDMLMEFKNNHQLDKINEESLGLTKKIITRKSDLEGTVYLPIILKHVLLPHHANKSSDENGILLHISEFEIVLELINQRLKLEDYTVLQTYNNELFELLLNYKKNIELYKKNIHNEIILNTMISHLFAIFYFDQSEYNNDYQMINQVVENSILNYQQFINYCYDEGICENFGDLFLDNNSLQKEYEVAKKMLDYVYNKEKEEKRK